MSTAVAQLAHRFINVGLKYFREFCAKLVHLGCFTVVEPGVVKHQVHVVTKLQHAERNIELWKGNIEWISLRMECGIQ